MFENKVSNFNTDQENKRDRQSVMKASTELCNIPHSKMKLKINEQQLRYKRKTVTKRKLISTLEL